MPSSGGCVDVFPGIQLYIGLESSHSTPCHDVMCKLDTGISLILEFS